MFGKLKKILEIIRREFRSEPMVIEQDILKQIAGQVGLRDGLHYFPSHSLRIQIVAAGEEQRREYNAWFCEEDRLAEKVHQSLRRKHVADAERLPVSVELVAQPGPEWPSPLFNIVYDWVPPPSLSPPRPAAVLLVLRGQTPQPECTLGARTLIGRSPESNEAAELSGRNRMISFLDNQDSFNATVSRAHARIEFNDHARAYLLYDEDSRYGTGLERDGNFYSVEGPRGVALADGDLLYFGDACARFCLSATDEKIR